jgi:hypothetical protein
MERLNRAFGPRGAERPRRSLFAGRGEQHHQALDGGRTRGGEHMNESVQDPWGSLAYHY